MLDFDRDHKVDLTEEETPDENSKKSERKTFGTWSYDQEHKQFAVIINGIADCCRRQVQIEGRRTEASVPGDGDHSLEFHQPTLVHCHNSLDTPSQFISIIATINSRYVAAIPNDARRLECPKPPSPTSSSAP
jgi:hypothetical protein